MAGNPALGARQPFQALAALLLVDSSQEHQVEIPEDILAKYSVE